MRIVNWRPSNLRAATGHGNAAVVDPRSIFLTLAMLSLLTGGVLGLMHRSLLPDVQRAAVLWRQGTLMVAMSGAMFAFQDLLPRWLGVIVANGLLLFGLTTYLHALRSFFALPSPRLAYLLAAVVIALLGWFVLVVDLYAVRVGLSSVLIGGLLLVSALTVHQNRRSDLETSARIMAGILFFSALVMAARMLSAPFLNGPNVLVPNVMNILAGLVGAIFPVVGTTAFLMMCSDRARLRLLKASVTDELTDLPNRRALAEFAATQRRQLGAGRSVALLLFDLDRFKLINDTYGHEAGDRALIHVAGILKRLAPNDALAGRFGGEEFLCVLPVTSIDTAMALAEAIRAELARSPMQLGQERMTITASFGVSLMESNADALDRALAKADRAMYRAKASGRNRVELFDQVGQASANLK
ncbi:hypothetical protein C7S18_04935 [Ahniella affigens]|uniref:diguanylate cyclase n=1 Tax=Ahniella affigens TaxID=2021234 RepID=A0A2P1PP32_9GAMM|nr:GGDEF domain-containing protein [Ahniella affigens]AVP96587.1 hypothetical protein C7S18_04935 [Ahniella affigens]